MSRGKLLSLEEARKQRMVEQFAKEHPAEGDAEKFDRLFRAMASGKPASKSGTSDAGPFED